MENEKHLKPEIYYRDLYDRDTVEFCRRTEEIISKQKLPPYEGKEFTKEQAVKFRSFITDYCLHFDVGERYLKKERTIQEWMDADRAKDELYESAQAPENIRCLACRNLMKPTTKDLWTMLDKPNRVLFMYECPNKCLPHRAFFNDGEEWRVKLNLCPNCNTKLKDESINSEEKLITKSLCPSCGYTNTDELVWTHKQAEPLDEKFAEDRDRFCLTEEKGWEYGQEKVQIEQAGKFMKEWEEKQKAIAEKLKANPNGFHLEGAGYTCSICRDNTSEGDNWYDEYGVKCLVCQKAIDEGEIPASLAKDEESWYSSYDIEDRFNVKSPTWRKWVRDGVLKVRTVSNYGKGVHKQLFLIEDNKDFLPPKKLTKSQMVDRIENGKKYYHSEPWYKFIDPQKHLKGYKIIDFIKDKVIIEKKAEEKPIGGK